MEPEKKIVLKWRIDTRLAAVKKLEHHFRLQSAISKREKQLAEDFPSDLLSDLDGLHDTCNCPW